MSRIGSCEDASAGSCHVLDVIDLLGPSIADVMIDMIMWSK